MICPVPCADCGRMVPLSSVRFVYQPGVDRSDRGLCKRCWREHEEEKRERDPLHNDTEEWSV